MRIWLLHVHLTTEASEGDCTLISKWQRATVSLHWPLLCPQSQLAVWRVRRERKAVTAAAVVLRRFLGWQLLPQRLQLSLIHHPLLLQSCTLLLQVLLLQDLDHVLHGVCIHNKQHISQSNTRDLIGTYRSSTRQSFFRKGAGQETETDTNRCQIK